MEYGVTHSSHPILVKLSGEAFGGSSSGVDGEVLNCIGHELLLARDINPRIAVVVGGGNFYRGITRESDLINRVEADYVGMLATVMNGIILQKWMERKNVRAKLLSAIPVGTIVEGYSKKLAKEYLDADSVVILAGGTGNPFFTTDTTAVLRALELDASLVVKATKVEGVFDCDPEDNAGAIKFDTIDYDTALKKNLAVMDATAFTLCKSNGLSIRVLNVFTPGNLKEAFLGNDVGTLVHQTFGVNR